MTNANIILQGRQPDMVNVLSRANQAAGQHNDIQHQARYRNALLQHGAGAMQGNQESMNALAGFDPAAVQGMQANNLNMDATRQQMDMQAKKYAASLSAQQAAQEASQMEATMMRVAQLAQLGDIQGANALLRQSDPDAPMMRSAEDLPTIMMGAKSVIGALKDVQALQPEVVPPADEYGRYAAEEVAAGRQPLSRIDFAQAKKGNGVSMTTPDGTVLQVGGNSSVKFTEGQGKDNVYSTRARGALDVLEPVSGALTSVGNRAAELDPTGLSRGLQSEDFQVAMQAGTEFLQAILRKDTGAAITEGEENSYGKTYLPQVGDGPAVLEAKRKARIRAVNALESGMSAQQMLVRDRALVKSAEEAREGAPASGSIEIPDFGGMSVEQIDQWIMENSQ